MCEAALAKRRRDRFMSSHAVATGGSSGIGFTEATDATAGDEAGFFQRLASDLSHRVAPPACRSPLADSMPWS